VPISQQADGCREARSPSATPGRRSRSGRNRSCHR